MAGPAWFVKSGELRDSRTGSPFMAGGERQYERRWTVVTNIVSLDPNTVCQAPGIPLPYSPYVSDDGFINDLNAVAVSFRAEKVDAQDDGFHWIVTVTYSTKVPVGGIPALTMFGSSAMGSQNNPHLEPPDVEWDWEIIREAPARDLDGRAFLNSANQPFTPAPTFEKAIAVLVYSRNELTYNRQTATRYAFAVNSDPFLDAPPGTAQCLPPRGKLEHRGEMQFWRVTYRIRFGAPRFPQGPGTITVGAGESIASAVLDRPARAGLENELETWQPEILDAGLCQLQTNAARSNFNQPVPIRRHGTPITQPVCLDGHGRVLEPVDGRITPVFLKFRRYRAVPFSKILVLGLGFPS